jgi:hypothetical protein
LAGPSGHARLVNTGHDYCWLVDSRCRAFIHCSKAASLADGSADPDVRRAIAAHADLRQPRQADFEKLGRSLLVSEGRSRRGWFLRQAAGERRLRRHFGFFFGNSALGGAMTRTSRPTRHKEQQPQRSVTATNLISAKGNFVVAFPGAARRPRMTRGRCGSLHLHRKGLAPSTPCRSPGALTNDPKRSLQAAPWTRCFG